MLPLLIPLCEEVTRVQGLYLHPELERKMQLLSVFRAHAVANGARRILWSRLRVEDFFLHALGTAQRT